MLYAGSRTLLGLGFVVMDEVHYLADRSRGAVWEEVIIHLPESVTVVSLSRDGLQRRGVRRVAGDRPRRDDHDRRGAPAGPALPARDGRQPAARPVRLLRRRRGGRLRQGGRPGQRRAGEDRPRRLGQHPADARPALAPQGQAGLLQGQAPDGDVGNGRRVWIPSRADVVDRLDREGLLPAIVFIFSRVGCDAAVTAVPQRRRPADHARRSATRSTRTSRPRCRDLPDEDLHVLGYHDFLDGLTRGIAAHHAGMLPAFKQVVEELFVRGLCKVVFATETLALGINMPARTVVIEKLTQVERRDPRRHHAGGVHPAHRPGRPPRPRRRGPRRRALAARHEPARGRRPRLDPHLPAPLVVPPVVQHGGQPGAPVRPGDRRASCSSSPSPSSRPTRPWSGWPGSCARARRRSRATPRPRRCHLGDFMEYAGLRRRIGDAREGRQQGPPRRPARGGARVAAACSSPAT